MKTIILIVDPGSFIGGGLIGGLIFSGIYLLKNPLLLTKWKSILTSILKKYSERLDKEYVQSNIEFALNNYTEDDLGFEVNKRFKLKWKENVDEDSYIERGDLILCLDKSEGQAQNIAKATNEYVNRTIIPESRKFLHDTTSQAINFVTAIDILDRYGDDTAKEKLYDEIVIPNITKENGGYDTETKNKLEKLGNNRKNGTLGPILLEELSTLPNYGRIPDESIQEKADELVDYLNRVAERDPGEKVPLQFDNGFFDLSLGLIGRQPQNTRFYINRCTERLDEVDSIYLLSAGSFKIGQTKKIAWRLRKEPRVRHINETTYKLPDDAFYNAGNEGTCIQIVTQNSDRHNE